MQAERGIGIIGRRRALEQKENTMGDDYEKGLAKPLNYGERQAIDEMRRIDKQGEADRRRVAEIERSGIDKSPRRI
jgi:hypothetical protein